MEGESKTEKYIVSVYPRWCKKCGICVAFCPKSALSEDSNGVPYLANSEACTGCRVCEMMCPDLAIIISAVEDEAENE